MTPDITLDNIPSADEADAAGLVAYEYNKENNDVYQQQQHRQAATTSSSTVSTTSLLLDKLQWRIESRNQRNAAKSRLVTAADTHAEKADTESAQTETPPDKKQRVDSTSSRLVSSIGRSPRIEDLAADAGLNSLSGCGGCSGRRRQSTDSTVMCRNVEFTNRGVTSRLDEIRQRYKSEVFVDRITGPDLDLIYPSLAGNFQILHFYFSSCHFSVKTAS